MVMTTMVMTTMVMTTMYQRGAGGVAVTERLREEVSSLANTFSAFDLSVSAWAEGREVNSRDTIGITNPIS